MAENKKSFVAYCDWESQLDLLSDDEAGKLFRHLLAYVNDKSPEFKTDERILKMAFEPIRLQLKRDLDKYEEVKKKRSEAGRSGGLKSGETRSKLNQSEPNEASASFAKKNEANEAVNDNVTVNVNDTVNVILLEKETKEENLHFPISQELDFGNEVKTDSEPMPKKVAQKKVFRPPTVQEVQNYCNERTNGISAFGFVSFYQSKDWMIGKNKMKDWQAAIRTWEQKNKENGKSNTNNSNNGFGGQNGNSFGGSKVSGKASFNQILARKLNSSGNSESGGITIDAEVVE